MEIGDRLVKDGEEYRVTGIRYSVSEDSFKYDLELTPIDPKMVVTFTIPKPKSRYVKASEVIL